jgi:hypothetical protein
LKAAWRGIILKFGELGMTDASMPADVAASPAGEAMRFVLEKLRARTPLTAAEFATHFTQKAAVTGGDGRFDRRFAQLSEFCGAFTVTGYRLPSANVGVIELTDEKGRGQTLGVALWDGRINGWTFGGRPPGFISRPAAPADTEGLIALELATPIVTGDVQTVYDRSRDYFEAERLMDANSYVVEREGVIVALVGSVVHPIRVNGQVMQGVCQHRERVHPSAQRSGVHGLVGMAIFEAEAGQTGDRMPYSFIAADNVASLNAGLADRPIWPARCERLVIDTVGAAEKGFGRSGQKGDAERLTELLNNTHGQEELYFPYTATSIRERLEREPATYSWSSFLVSERACVGVWAPKIGVIRRVGGVETRTVRAFVLDYGCTADGVSELVALIDEWRATLAAGGTDELAIFTSAGSHANAELTALAKRREPYVVSCLVRPNDRVNEQGIYVDQLYF